ncbi:hypothetical protein ABW21_db0200395 [Orbilia brochopaga]|nr:hypothetical protein ABW21_db0200395 [Drechslerella brochopaga]
MHSVAAFAGLAAYATGVSALIIDAVQVPSPTFKGTLPVLRLCRPAPGEDPIVINPATTSCPIDPTTGRDVTWKWDYNGTPSVNGRTLVNLYGPTGASGEVPKLLNEVAYGTKFAYGYTNPGLPRQASQFRVLRNGVPQAIDVNNKLQKMDILEFYGPTDTRYPDTTLRLNRASSVRQAANAGTWVLSRQIVSSNGQPSNIGILPTVVLRIADLGDREVVGVAPKQPSWLQRGASWLSNTFNSAANIGQQALESLGDAGTNAQTWAARTAAALSSNPGKVLDNAINTIARPLANAGDQVGNAVSNLYDTVAGTPSKISQQVSEDLSGVQNAVADGLLAVSQAVNDGLITAQQGYAQLRQGITRAASQGWEQAKRQLSTGILGGIANFFGGSGSPSTATSQVSNLGNGVAGQSQPGINVDNNVVSPVVADANAAGQLVVNDNALPVVDANAVGGSYNAAGYQPPLASVPESSFEEVSVVSDDSSAVGDYTVVDESIDLNGDGFPDVSVIEASEETIVDDGAPAGGWGEDSLTNILDSMSSSQLIAGQA